MRNLKEVIELFLREYESLHLNFQVQEQILNMKKTTMFLQKHCAQNTSKLLWIKKGLDLYLA